MTTTVELSKFYMLQYSALKQEVRQITWNKVPGKNKLRRFFVRDNWQDFIVSVDVSGSGAKGGVFFLECDVLDFAALATALGGSIPAKPIWDNLIKDGLITEQGFKSAAARDGRVPTGGIYVGSRPKIVTLVKQPNIQRCFVVKGAEEPARTLFAEYVLSRIGKAKIPKSLVLAVDPQRPANGPNPSEGMVMLQLLRDKRSTQASARRYAQCYGYLDDGKDTDSSCVSYLVVQKMIKGDQLPIYESIVGQIETFFAKWKLQVTAKTFLDDPAFQDRRADGTWVVTEDAVAALITDLTNQKCLSDAGVVDKDYRPRLAHVTSIPAGKGSDVERILKASYDALQANSLQFTGASVDILFDQLNAALQAVPSSSPLNADFQLLRARQAAKMRTLEAIITDGEKMINTGAVMLADLLIGIGDRFESMNVENCFYTDKLRPAPGNSSADVQDAKVSKPIACIDNEAIMQAFEPPRTFRDPSGKPIREGFADRAKYVDDLVTNGIPELWGSSQPLPAAYVLVRSARLEHMLKLPNWFSRAFTNAFTARMPECVLAQMSPNLWDRTGPTPQLGAAWGEAEEHIRGGFCATLQELKATHLYEFRQVYRSLLSVYGRSSNFDFAAFEVRYWFLRQMVVSKSSTIMRYDAKAIKAGIAARQEGRSGRTGLSGIIAAALQSREAAPILQAAHVSRDQVVEVLTMLSVRKQEALVPSPTGKLDGDIHFGLLEKAAQEEKLAALKAAGAGFERRMQAIICAIVAKFAADYRSEAAGGQAYVYVPASRAYQQACFNADQFSRAKVYKDDGGGATVRLRRQLLADYGLTAYVQAATLT